MWNLFKRIVALARSLFVSLCVQVINRSPSSHLLVTALFPLCSLSVFSSFFLLFCSVGGLTLLVLCSCATLFFLLPLPSLAKCVYTESQRPINPVMLLGSIPHRVSQFSQQTVMDGFCSPYTFHMLTFSFLHTLHPLPLCFHTQWRPFLPGLKYEVIDSAYISLYTGKSYSAILIYCMKGFLSWTWNTVHDVCF